MKSAILLAILLVSTLAYRVDLEANKITKTEDIDLKQAMANGQLRRVTPEQIRKTLAGGYTPLTNNLDNLKSYGNPSIDLSNYKDLQYNGPGLVGSHDEKFTFVYDTGSAWIWVSQVGCEGCPPTEGRFDPTTSDTYVDAGERKQLNYGLGSVTGEVGYDHVSVPGSDPVTAKLITADTGKDNDGDLADGIIGLTPVTDDGADLLVSKLAEAGVIDAEEFTVYIGKDGYDGSWIEFGTNHDDQSEVTWVDLKKLPGTKDLIYWSTDFDQFTVRDDKVDLTYTSTIWDTGTSLIGFYPQDLMKVITKLANGKQIYNVQDQFYAIECDGVSDIDSLDFTFNGHTISVDAHEFTEAQQGYCIFLLMQVNLPGMLLGDSFLRGSKIIHDQAGQRFGLFPQHHYNYKEKTASELIWDYLPIVGASAIALVMINKFFF